MDISAVYAEYSIPINLQNHMLRVAALGSLICDQLDRQLVDKDLIVKTLLLHDMGNILKYNFSRIDLFDEADRKNIEKYKIVQRDFEARYGSDPDIATLKIIKETSTDKRIENLCEQANWLNLKKYVSTNRWDVKICTYCDMRTGPFGLLTLTERIQDLKLRRPEESEDLDILLEQGLLVEQQLIKVTNNQLLKITTELVERKAKQLRTLEI